MYKYNADFYQYLNQGAVDSARGVIPEVRNLLPAEITSILDVGCGAGAWLSVWKSFGCNVIGLDGDYVEKSAMMIDAEEFHIQDLSQPFDMSRRFDLCQSLEVAEHLPASAAAQFIKTLCSTSDVVLFSAAPPGQGGENHINEQPYEYWQALFEQNSYQMYDAIRPRIANNKKVMPWYRYNVFLFVNKARLPDAHSRLAAYRIDSAHPPEDTSPLHYKAQKYLMNAIPIKHRTALAVLKKKIVNNLVKWLN